MIQITAIVCTYNRADMLGSVIDSLVAQTLPAQQYEILIVDNASEDGTTALLQQRAKEIANLRYVRETLLGLSNARNTGLRLATAPVVAFLDDDAKASPDWLKGICSAFDAFRPRPGIVCGPVKADWGAERPSWLRDYWLPFYSVVDWSDETRCLTEEEWVVGANFAVDRELALELGGFDAALGRRGPALLSHEETALTEGIRRAGHPIVYEPSIPVEHRIHEQRLSKSWFYRRVFWGAISETAQSRRDYNWRQRLVQAVRAGASAAAQVWSLDQFRETEEASVLRYHGVFRKLGEARGYLFGSARLF